MVDSFCDLNEVSIYSLWLNEAVRSAGGVHYINQWATPYGAPLFPTLAIHSAPHLQRESNLVFAKSINAQ
jgi:hypothetical protein